MSDTDVLPNSVVEDGSPDRLAIDTIRTLAMDAVQKANSGHPGTPMAMAPVGYALWKSALRFDPAAPLWPNRDRFVLSIGHASMLLYSLLHLAGVEEFGADGAPTGKPAISMEDLQSFRQFGSKTPGHPEYRMTTGVETTTGPLGQGCGNSVGMAIAERWQAAHFNRFGFPIFDHDVYVLCGDGDLMEGISGEAASLAGHLRLSNLCWIYDSNTISIEGHTDIAFTEDVAARFRAYGWNTLTVEDANDTEALLEAIAVFRETNDRPTFITVRSVIGYGSPKANSEKAHGEPLGVAEVAATKAAYGWDSSEAFHVPAGVAEGLSEQMRSRSRPLREGWEAMRLDYAAAHPLLAIELETMLGGGLPETWRAAIPVFPTDPKGIASRESGGRVENAIAGALPWLVGGAADVSPSTKTNFTFEGAGSLQSASYGGRNVHFGVREHAMGAVVNGMALSGLRAFGSAFLVFSDYMRTPIRLASIMEIPSIFVFTHDSIGVGEDGPTHQPIEHLAALRAIPGLNVIRPGDANEVAVAWQVALESSRVPTVMILSRQALPTLDRVTMASADGLREGGYVLADAGDVPEVILIATGSEVSLALEAHRALVAGGVRSRVVSMPSRYLFDRQDAAYRESVLPSKVRARVAIEQAGPLGWSDYVGLDGATVTMSSFGASAKFSDLQREFGFTCENVLDVALAVLDRSSR
ncbi:transketolase [Sphingomonas glacialis]|uniref:Transketolase n=1 Tax=Sphingomonas glacialis TaxID=658225 RepID=A0A502FS21_9SPHN|nr:transketolase [Sphingomonas glacialis]TPG52255.1 transketolase [Sphingomonas glacialis]